MTRSYLDIARTTLLECSPKPPTPEMLASLGDDQRELFEERAAILQFDGGLPRQKAECLAWEFVQLGGK